MLVVLHLKLILHSVIAELLQELYYLLSSLLIILNESCFLFFLWLIHSHCPFPAVQAFTHFPCVIRDCCRYFGRTHILGLNQISDVDNLAIFPLCLKPLTLSDCPFFLLWHAAILFVWDLRCSFGEYETDQ